MFGLFPGYPCVHVVCFSVGRCVGQDVALPVGHTARDSVEHQGSQTREDATHERRKNQLLAQMEKDYEKIRDTHVYKVNKSPSVKRVCRHGWKKAIQYLRRSSLQGE